MLIEIYTKEQLKDIENNMSGDYVLMNDIDLDGAFEPIGYAELGGYTGFTGTFDGNGHTVYGGVMNHPADDRIGLFAWIGDEFGVERGTIKNVTVDNTVVGNSYVGGLAGGAFNVVIENCRNYGSIEGDSYVGGLTGHIDNGGFTRCINKGSVTATWDAAGGITAFALYPASLEYCFNEGSITSENSAGGILTDIDGGTIRNCYNRGSVEGRSVGGIAVSVHEHSSAAYCYNVGFVSGLTGSEGGLVGNFETVPPTVYGSVDKSYHTGPDNGWGTLRTDSEMKRIITFVEWDIVAQENVIQDNYGWNSNHVWGIGVVNDGYPFLNIHKGLFNIWTFKGGQWHSIGDTKTRKGLWSNITDVWVKKSGAWKSV